MIINLLINLLVLIVGALFSFLPIVTKLPTIFGFDIDSALVTGVGQLTTFTNTFWPVHYLILGFLFLLGYYGIKMALRFIIGHRAPGHS